jgi:hypothetical protein
MLARRWYVRKSCVAGGGWNVWQPIGGGHVVATVYDTHAEALDDVPRLQRWADRGFR